MPRLVVDDCLLALSRRRRSRRRDETRRDHHVLRRPSRDKTNSYPAAIGKYKPQDATTNPSLILAASKKSEYAALTDVAIKYAKAKGGALDDQVDLALDRLLVEYGKEILKIIPGKVSTEVDARFSFDTKASIEKALHIIEVSTPTLGASTLSC